jgi:hypothetical protein
MFKQMVQFLFYTFLIAVFAIVAFVVNQMYMKPTPSLDSFKKIENEYKLVDSLVTKKKVKLSTGITMSLYESGVQKEDNIIIFSHGFPEVKKKLNFTFQVWFSFLEESNSIFYRKRIFCCCSKSPWI